MKHSSDDARVSSLRRGLIAPVLSIVGVGILTVGALVYANPRAQDAATLQAIAAVAVLAGILLLIFLRRAKATMQRIERDGRLLTERHRELIRRESRIRAVVGNVAEGIVTTDGDGVVESVNPAAERLFGYASEALVGKTIGRLFDGAAEGVLRGWLEERAGMLDSASVQDENGRRHDGSLFRAGLSVSEIRVEEGRRFILMVRDTTAQERARETLDLLATAMVVVDGAGTVLLANRSAARLFQTADGLTVADGIIAAWRAEETAALIDAIRGAMAVPGVGGAESNVLNISRPSLKRPLAVLVRSMKANGADGRSASAAIFVRDPERRWDVPTNLLADLFGLTPAEARVVTELVNGKRVPEIAEAGDVSLHTVRNQLREAYRKTGTSRQPELVSLVLSSTAFVSDQFRESA